MVFRLRIQWFFFSNLHINMLAYDGAVVVPIAVYLYLVDYDLHQRWSCCSLVTAWAFWPFFKTCFTCINTICMWNIREEGGDTQSNKCLVRGKWIYRPPFFWDNRLISEERKKLKHYNRILTNAKLRSNKPRVY